MTFSCNICGNDSGTSLVCTACLPYLNDNQKLKTLRAWHRIVVENAGNACEDCGHSAEFDSGELCGDHIHTQASRPDLRYDVTNGISRCTHCHNKRHTGQNPVVPPSSHVKKQEKKEQKKGPKKDLCKKCNLRLAIPELKGKCIACK